MNKEAVLAHVKDREHAPLPEKNMLLVEEVMEWTEKGLWEYLQTHIILLRAQC